MTIETNWPIDVSQYISKLPKEDQHKALDVITEKILNQMSLVPDSNMHQNDQTTIYALCLVACTIILMSLNDVAKEADIDRSILLMKTLVSFFYGHSKEADIDRSILLMKTLVPFFYGHSKLSKYFIDFILWTQQTVQVLH